MKKVLCITVALLFCLLVFTACTSTSQDNVESEPKIISIDGGTISGKEITLNVSKYIDNVFLFDLIKVTDDAIWKVIDINSNVIANKTVRLVDGNNIFYIEVSLPDGTKSTMYTLLINKAKDITVTYLATTIYGFGERILKEVKVEPGTLFKAAYIPNLEGFDFFYWHKRGSEKEFKEEILNYDTQLIVKASKKTAILHLIVEGEEWQTINCEYGDWVNLPVPTKQHYHFGDVFSDRWYYDKECISSFGTEYRCYNSGDIYIYGKFVPTTYKITYDFGEIAHNRKEYQSVVYSNTFELYELNFPYTTYNGIKYYIVGYTYNGEPFVGGKYLYDGDIKVEAVWMPESEYKQNN
ncbi:MAG: hypothetical protein NC131_16385 [Roseburia sp.]|nr:hypothetical protein [Bacillota bacterium]MCM1394012.1 hypothetical protein [[Eubacterium] siraeum]MCM1440757.1 hypothetical protein [Roseburia sp.]